MIVLGIDPSSSVCGLAVVEGNRLLRTDAWVRPKEGSAAERLVDYFLWLHAWLSVNQEGISMAVIEFLSVERNAQTTRVVSHYQAVSAVVCKLNGLIVIESRVSSARKAALGKGNLSKAEAFNKIKAMFPDEKWGRLDGDGADRADAAVLALAGPRVAER